MEFNLNLDMNDILNEIQKQSSTKNTFLKFAEGDTIVRLMPPVHGHKVPWTFTYNHFVKMPTGKWEGINCPTTQQKVCAICKHVSELYDSKDPVNIAVAKKLKRNKKYYYNVYLVDTPHKDFKEYIGKVIVMQVGPKINDIIQRDLKNPAIGLSLFNPVDGYNFVITMNKNNANMANYDLSTTARQKTSIVSTQEELNALLDQCADLGQFVKENTFEETKDYLGRFNASFDEYDTGVDIAQENAKLFEKQKTEPSVPVSQPVSQPQAVTPPTTMAETTPSSSPAMASEPVTAEENAVVSTIEDYLKELE